MPIDWSHASADEMLTHLSELDLEAFEAACDNEQFTEDHVRVLLTNPSLPPPLLDRISREPRFFKRSSVRVGLVLHPKTPRVRSLELVRYLFWRDLLRAASIPSVNPQVRVVADQLLAERVPDLTLGEKLTLARMASRGTLRALRTDADARVIEAVLRNPRFTEEDALFIASSSETQPQILAVLARSTKWRARAPVRSQLVRNRRLQLPIALGLLRELSRGEVMAVTHQADLPKVLRQSARRLLEETARPGRA